MHFKEDLEVCGDQSLITRSVCMAGGARGSTKRLGGGEGGGREVKF